MQKLKLLLHEFSMTIGLAICLGTWWSAKSMLYGSDASLILQSLAAAIFWIPAGLIIVWLIEWLVKLVANIDTRQNALKRMRLLYLCYFAIFQPVLTYANFGMVLFISVLATVLWRSYYLGDRKLSKNLNGWLENSGEIKTGLTAAAILTVVYIAVVFAFPAQLPQPSGDSPHYLLQSFSLLKDFDLDLANNYREKDYQQWHEGEIQPHTKPGANRGEQFSMHTAGLSIYLVPFLAIGLAFGQSVAIHFATRIGIIIIATLFVFVLFRLVFRLFGNIKLAFWLTLLVGSTVPTLFLAYHIFGEIFIAFASTSAIYVLWRPNSPGAWERIGLGILLGLFPWFGAKYLLMTLPFLALWIWRELKWGLRINMMALVVIPGLIIGLLFFYLTWDMYGTISPAAYYLGADGSLTEQNVALKVTHSDGIFSAIGMTAKVSLAYLIDQRQGLIFYSPWYLLAFAGFIAMWKKGDQQRNLLLWLLALAVPYYLLYAASGMGTGHSPPARFMLPIIWLFIIPAASFISAVGIRSFLFRTLIFLSLGMSMLHIAIPTFLYHDFHVPASHMLSWLSAGGFDFTQIFPSLNSRHFENLTVSMAWSAILAFAIYWLLCKQKVSSINISFLPLAFATLYILLVTVNGTPPQWEKSYQDQESGSQIYFATDSVYIGPRAFWVRTASKADCYLISDQPQQNLEVRLRTVVPNDVTVANGVMKTSYSFFKGEAKTVQILLDEGFRRNGKYVYRFLVDSKSGNPEGLIIRGKDSRALGVEIILQ